MAFQHIKLNIIAINDRCINAANNIHILFFLFFLHQIGKIIKKFALVLGVLLLAAFLGLGVACILAAGAEDVDEALKTAGLQAAVISFVLAILSPLFSLVLYAVGATACAVHKQAEDLGEMKALLRQALSDGMLSEEVARKVAQSQEKLLAQLQAAAPAKSAPTNAPVQRYVEEPIEQAEETEEVAEAPETEAETAADEITDKAEAAEQNEELTAPAQAPESAEVQPILAAPAKPARTRAKATKPPATAIPLRPIGADDEVF